MIDKYCLNCPIENSCFIKKNLDFLDTEKINGSGFITDDKCIMRESWEGVYIKYNQSGTIDFKSKTAYEIKFAILTHIKDKAKSLCLNFITNHVHNVFFCSYKKNAVEKVTSDQESKYMAALADCENLLQSIEHFDENIK